MSEERSKLAIFTILVTTIGIVISTQYNEIGLTVMFVAILLFAFTIVRNRLQAIGAEAFALGSIIVWTGFLLAAFPLIAYAWGFLEGLTQGILFGTGLILIFMGFTTEYYDLNIKFLNLLSHLQKRFAEIIATLRKRIFRSIWTFVAVFSTLVGLLGLIVPNLLIFVPNLLNIEFGVSIQFFILALVSIGLEFRELIWISLKSLLKTGSLLIRAVFQRLKQFPQLIVDTGRLLISYLYRFGQWIIKILNYLRTNTYLLGFMGSIILGYFAINKSDPILGSATVLVLLISLVNILGVQQDEIGIRVGNLQQSAYRQSFKVRNLIRREHSGKCPDCGHDVQPGISYCDNCGNFIPDCLVCRNTIYAGEETLTCPNCEHMGHADHIERWLSIRSICPNCRTEWQ